MMLRKRKGAAYFGGVSTLGVAALKIGHGNHDRDLLTGRPSMVLTEKTVDNEKTLQNIVLK